MGIANSGSKGGACLVHNIPHLQKTILQMLQADLAELRKKYDHVFVHMPGGLRRGGSFFDQLLTTCDSVILVASAGKPMMGMATDVSAKVVRKEMEAVK